MATGWRGLPVVGKGATKTLERIFEGLGPVHQSKIIDNKPGTYMAVHAEWLGKINFGDMFSIAHYYEQQGDMMRDPDVVLVRIPDARGGEGEYYPVSFRQDSTGTFWEHLVFDENTGMPSRVSMKGMKDLASFMTTWMRNIKEQQRI